VFSLPVDCGESRPTVSAHPGAKYELTVLADASPSLIFSSSALWRSHGVLNSLRPLCRSCCSADPAECRDYRRSPMGFTLSLRAHRGGCHRRPHRRHPAGSASDPMDHEERAFSPALWMPRHPAVKKIGLLMLPAIFGSAVYQLNQFIGTLLASFLPQGSISWLYYADRIVEFPLGVFAIAISTAALPSLAKQVAGKDFSDFRETLGHALRLVFFITTPATVGMILLRVPSSRSFSSGGLLTIGQP